MKQKKPKCSLQGEWIQKMWYIHTMWGFPGNSEVKNMPAMQETQVKSLGNEDGLRWWLRPMEYF